MAVGSASCWRAVVIPLESELGRFEASTCGDGRHEVGAFGIYWTGKEVANHTLRVTIELVARQYRSPTRFREERRRRPSFGFVDDQEDESAGRIEAASGSLMLDLLSNERPLDGAYGHFRLTPGHLSCRYGDPGGPTFLTRLFGKDLH